MSNNADSSNEFGAIDVAVLMEQVRLEAPRGTVTVQGTIEALRTSSRDPNAIYGDLRGFDKSMMSFRCPVSSGLRKEEHVVLRGTLTSRRSTIHRGFDLELVGVRIGYWIPGELPSDDEPVLERAASKVPLERFLSKGDAKRLLLLGTRTGIDDAKSALSRLPGPALDQRITPTTLEGILPAIADAATKYDGLCLLRGGGDASSFATWNDRRLVDALNRSGKPFYTALGHANDMTLADKHADESFSTPTALGAAVVEARQIRNEWDQLQRRVQTLSRANSELKAANENATGEALGQRTNLLQTVVEELRMLPAAMTRQNIQLTADISKRLRFQTWTWLLSMFLLGLVVGGVCLSLLERSMVAGTQQKLNGTQQQIEPGAKPFELNSDKSHRGH